MFCAQHLLTYESQDLSQTSGQLDLYVMNVKTKSKKSIMKNVNNFQWIDNSRVLVSILWSNYVIDVSGNTTNISKETGIYYNHASISLIGDQFYYIVIGETSSTGGDFDVLDMTTGIKKLLMHYAEYFNVSPDQKSALVMTNDGSKTALEITDMNGKVKQTIKQAGKGILMDSWWSPDERLVAYSVSGNTSAKGLYLFDTKTGVSTKMESNTYGSNYDPTVIWNPSGDKIAMSTWNGSSFVSKIFYLQ
jgi:tricorn protease-like protein